MEAPNCCRQPLLVLLLWVNGLTMLGFAGAHEQTNLCNEFLMLEKLPACGKSFEDMMKKVDSEKWCNLTEFIIKYLFVHGKPTATCCDISTGIMTTLRSAQNVKPTMRVAFGQIVSQRALSLQFMNNSFPTVLQKKFTGKIHQMKFS
ncbi:receptor activity-modifying protein 3-like [Apus apus]|uniref:receptor activity-modifying protein 3-like n=1 Tax=Apus apus TaxID=8895 RepID=UPI0021F82378|nr:receptor activity-modifying protein 3-like [Apus apus]